MIQRLNPPEEAAVYLSASAEVTPELQGLPSVLMRCIADFTGFIALGILSRVSKSLRASLIRDTHVWTRVAQRELPGLYGSVTSHSLMSQSAQLIGRSIGQYLTNLVLLGSSSCTRHRLSQSLMLSRFVSRERLLVLEKCKSHSKDLYTCDNKQCIRKFCSGRNGSSCSVGCAVCSKGQYCSISCALKCFGYHGLYGWKRHGTKEDLARERQQQKALDVRAGLFGRSCGVIRQSIRSSVSSCDDIGFMES